MQTESHLSEFLSVDMTYERVSHMKRLGNYLIDIFAFYILLFLFGIFLGLFFPSLVADINFKDPSIALWDRFATLIIYALYMGSLETIFKGRSFGKFITGTRAVNLDGSAITGKTAFIRGLSRAVPFSAFSALGTPSNPWHDRWTNTMVVNNVRQVQFD